MSAICYYAIELFIKIVICTTMQHPTQPQNTRYFLPFVSDANQFTVY